MYRSIILFSPNSTHLNKNISGNVAEYPERNSTIIKNLCVIILKEQLGRLGNLMFKFASAYGLARHHRCKLYVDESYLRVLSAIFLINIRHMSISKLEYLNLSGIMFRGNDACHYFKDIMKPNSIKYVELVGYWQAFGHFIKYTDEIRQQFTFRTEIIGQITPFFIEQMELHISHPLNRRVQNRTKVTISNRNINALDQLGLKKHLRNSSFIFVGVHWRRGDFLQKDKLAYGHSVSSLDYLNKAMNRFLDKYVDVLFIMTSDEKDYCRNIFKKNSQVIITPDNFTREQDLAVLAVCQHTIVTTGTFGWFAGYLSGGDVLYDRLSPSKNTDLAKACPPKEYYPPHFLPTKR